jgi:hypothetical protein
MSLIYSKIYRRRFRELEVYQDIGKRRETLEWIYKNPFKDYPLRFQLCDRGYLTQGSDYPDEWIQRRQVCSL